MKKIYAFGFLMSAVIFGLTGCGGERSSNLNTTNMNRSYLNTNGNANSYSSTADANTNKSDTNANVANSNSAMPDKDFMTETAIGGMWEVELGKLAATKAQNADVKKFAQMMVTDHTKANAELKTLASSKNVTLPTELDAKHKSKMTEMQKLSGAEFDKEYVADMLADHEKDVKAFQTQAQNSTDADVKAFAAKTLPTLQKHLEAVRDLHNKMISGGNTNSNMK